MGKSIVLFLITALIFTSCNTKVIADFEVVNNTEVQVDSLTIYPNVDEVGKYISLNKGESAKYKADMTTIPKTDGSYHISFSMNGKKRSEVFGYYTNGFPLEKITKIKIEKDTILIDQIYEEY